MAVPGPFAFGDDFTSPYQGISFGAELKHGTHVANAANEFDNNVAVRPVQIYSIGSQQASSTDCSEFPARKVGQSTGVIGGTNKVRRALNAIADDPQGVGAVNMSIVFRQGYCDRQDNIDFQICTDKVGQVEVNKLKDLGIAFVIGLNNVDIGDDERTWPACLDNVIKVGAANDNGMLRQCD